MELPQGATVAHLVQEVLRRYPQLTTQPDRLVVAVNHEYRDFEFLLTDRDEVALIPPVSGGADD